MSIKPALNISAQPSTIRGVSVHLSYDPRSDRIAYAANKSIHVRSVADPEKSIQYIKHPVATTVAKFSPSGFYIASGDINGNVKIWDAVGEDHVTKGEYQVISGKICDIAWDADSQRIIAVGDGKEKFGHCFTADSGNSVGEISGHSEIVTGVDIRPVRPYRAATVSDDKSLCFYHGPPFRFNCSVKGKHTNFVYEVKFSPDGEYLVTVGADRKVLLYDGKTGELLEELNSPHEGGIYGVSWSPDSKQFVTASADSTVRLWDVASKQVVKTWKFARKLDYHQVGVVFAGAKRVISLSFNGDLNYLDVTSSSEEPERVVRGHQKSVTALALSGDKVISGSYDSSVLEWTISSGFSAERIDGPSAHQGMLVGIVKGSNSKLWSSAWDDTLRSIILEDGSGKFAFSSDVAGIGAQPVALSTSPDGQSIVVITDSQVHLFDKSGKSVATKTVNYSLSSVAVSSRYVAVGDKVNTVHLLNSKTLEPEFDLPALRNALSVLSFSPVTPKYLAAGDVSGKITLYDVEEKTVVTNRWAFHTGKVQSIQWHKTGDWVVSGGSDTNIIIYSVKTFSKNIKFLGAHKDGANVVLWNGEDKLISCGADATLKTWDVELPQV